LPLFVVSAVCALGGVPFVCADTRFTGSSAWRGSFHVRYGSIASPPGAESSSAAAAAMRRAALGTKKNTSEMTIETSLERR
jgi:hypothetical protein